MNIVTRAQWGARPPRSRHVIATPTRELWLHHTADRNHGPAGIRAIQRFHMDSRGWSDIAYSFLVDSDGTVYEGRGAGVAGGHTKNHNTISHAICAIGNYQTTDPDVRLLNTIAELVRHGHASGWWPAKLTGGHRDVGSTSCPGDRLYRHIDAINRAATIPPPPPRPDPEETVMKRGDKGPFVAAWIDAIPLLAATLAVDVADLDLAADRKQATFGGATQAATNRLLKELGRPESGIADAGLVSLVALVRPAPAPSIPVHPHPELVKKGATVTIRGTVAG